MKRLLLWLVLWAVLLGLLMQLSGYAVFVMPLGNLEIHLGLLLWAQLLMGWLLWRVAGVMAGLRKR